MNFILKIFHKIAIVLFLQLFCASQNITAQDTLSVTAPSGSDKKEKRRDASFLADTLVVTKGSKTRKKQETTIVDMNNDIMGEPVKQKPLRKGDPMKATMMSAVFPGGGQIYNRKYWKLPLVYAGFGALIYSFSSNSNDYQIYYKGYMDFTDDIRETDSYLEFVPGDPAAYDPVLYPGANPANTVLVKERMIRLMDYHKRYRDLSIILTGVWYLAQILDANVDASLMEYDVSDNLDLTFYPSLIKTPGGPSGGSFNLALRMSF